MRLILLHNVTAILLKKCDRILLQNASGLLLQNATVITNCDDFTTKYDSYDKMRPLSQIATVQFSLSKNKSMNDKDAEVYLITYVHIHVTSILFLKKKEEATLHNLFKIMKKSNNKL